MRQLIEAKRLYGRNADSSIRLFSLVLSRSRAIRFGKGERNALLNLAQAYYQTRQYDKSLRNATELLISSDSSEHKDAHFFGYYYSALSQHRLNRYPLAMDAYANALKFVSDTSHWVLGIYNNIGELHRINSHYNKALEFFEKAIKLSRSHGGRHESSLISVYTNAARIYTQRDDYKKATVYYDSAETIAMRHHEPAELFHIKLGQADILNKKGKPKVSLKKIEEARKILANTNQDLLLRHHADLYTGEAYMRIPQYDSAEKYYLRALESVDSNNHNDRMVLTHKLSNIYDHTGNYEKAYVFHLKSHNLLEEFKNKEVQAKLNEAEIRYETAEKDKTIALKNVQLLESKRRLARKNLWIVSTASGAIILGLLLLGSYRSYRRKRKMAQQEAEINRLKAMMDGEEKERIRLARELHDGVGSMLAAIKMNVGSIKNAYSDLPVSQRLETVVTMLQETSAEVRTTAHNLMPDVLTRHDLKEAVVQYIQKINQTHDIQIEFHTPQALEGLDKPAELVLYRMIQELVQNVLKHAEATIIEIQLVQLEQEITLTVEDNGKGMDVGNGAANSGYGLDNLKYRVQALQGELILDSIPGEGTSVIISFDRDKLIKASH